MATTVGVARL